MGLGSLPRGIDTFIPAPQRMKMKRRKEKPSKPPFGFVRHLSGLLFFPEQSKASFDGENRMGCVECEHVAAVGESRVTVVSRADLCKRPPHRDTPQQLNTQLFLQRIRRVYQQIVSLRSWQNWYRWWNHSSLDGTHQRHSPPVRCAEMFCIWNGRDFLWTTL